jgi:hypothetical protein
MKEVVQPIINAFRADSFRNIVIISACVSLLGLLIIILTVLSGKRTNKPSNSTSNSDNPKPVDLTKTKPPILPKTPMKEEKLEIPTTAPEVVNLPKRLIQ